MKIQKWRILVVGAALALLVTSALFTIIAFHPASANSGISSINDYYTPGGDPWGTAFDSSGRVWVALPGCDGESCSSSNSPGKLALFDPTVNNWATIVSLPSGYGQPLFVAVDHNGKIWFTMPATNAIARYDPATTTVSQWSVPTASAGPWDIAVDSQDKIWFTEHYSNKISSFDPVAHTFNEIATPSTGSLPYGITVDASNNIWFTENPDTVALIGEYTHQGVLHEYKIRNTSTGGTGLTPHLITLDHNGNVWWSEGWVHSIGRLNVATAQPGTNQGVTEYQYTPSGSGGSHTSGISVDGLGKVWLDDSLENAIASFPVGGGSFSFTSVGNHPHDGLNVDSQNRVWFSEEFANKLAVAIQSSGSLTPTPTSSSTPTATATSTATVTPTSTPTPGTLAQDTFQRANQGLWGKASDGHTWGGDANSSAAFSISSNAGMIINGGGTSYSAVLGYCASNAEVYATGSISAFSSNNFGDVLRWKDGNNWYKAYIDGANLIIQKKVSGATTVLASVPFAASGGTSYSIHFRVVGTTLTANVWAASGSESSGWMATASDSSLSSGQCGLRLLTQSKTVTITAFRANAL